MPLARRSAVSRGTRVPLARVLPGSLWAREWLLTVLRPRALAIRIAMPLLLSVPLVLGHAPTFWAGMLLTVLVAMVGAVGCGITLARARSAGLLARLATAPRPAPLLVGGWVVGAASVDLVQLLPVAALVIVAGGGDAGSAAALLLSLGGVLLITNAIGCALAVVAEGPGEVLLDVVVVLAPLLFLGGLFTGVPRTGWRAGAARLDPFAYLHSAFIGALGGAPSFESGTVAVAAVASAAGALVVIALLSRALLDRR